MTDDDWKGSARFALRRTLGSGGTGVVYHAFDRQRGQDVALKTLRFVEPEAIYRLKREFRAMLELSHPNLVQLHELGSEDGLWFISMELVRGMSFLEYVSENPPTKVAEPTVQVSARTSPMSAGVTIAAPLDDGYVEDTDVDATLAERSAESGSGSTDGGPSGLTLGRDVLALYATVKRPAWDVMPTEDPVIENLATTRARAAARAHVERLKSGVRQLAEGLLAIHAAGKLHRDVKPSNVLVTPSGRVVILDFGLVTELFPDPTSSFTEHGIAGTVPYMAPEIASPEQRSPAVDWYAVGVMLYQALSGRLPFPGAGIDVIFRKQREDPPPPSAHRAGIPRDLEALAMALLERDPKKRLRGEDLVARLGARDRAASQASVVPRRAPHATTPFVGRQRHLDALDAALGRAKRGQPSLVLVRGLSGIGKSTLVRTFLDEVRDREHALVLSGRCHERESVPFKALDPVIDALSRHLARLPIDRVQAILPRTIRALARVFPTLLRVDAIQNAPRLAAETPDPHELRRRAFAALKELLTRLAEHTPVVVSIDDLQWGDEDSATMLLELLRQPGGAPVLFVASHRQEDEAQSPMLKALRERARDVGADVRVLTVGALSDDEARDLALSLLQGSEGDVHLQAERIARESRGNPFFVEQLAHHSQREAAKSLAPLSGEISLDRVLEKRLQRLPRASRRVLEVVSVAGRPLEAELVARVAVLGHDESLATLAALKTGSLVRTQGQGVAELVEPYHDRVREVVVAQLPLDAQREIHRAIAEALERLPEPPAEAILFHWREAGEQGKAVRFAALAAEHATATLAFDRAAQLYRFAIEASPAEVRPPLVLALAEVLTLAGRGAEAADRYLEVARAASPERAIDLTRLAAERLMTSGHVDRGLDLLQQVLGAVGLRLAKSPRAAYFSRWWRRGQLWRRGFEFDRRAESELPRAELQHVDILWSTVLGLALFDVIRAVDFQSRHVLLALELGEPYRVARALALESGFVSTGGGHGQWRTARLIEELHKVADECGHPHALGLAAFAEGAAAYFEGGWGRAKVLLERAEEIYRDKSVNVAWELMATRMLLHSTLFHLGHLSVLAKRAPALIEDADARGDLFAGTIYRTGQSTAVWLAADNPERALRSIDDGLALWSKRGYFIQQATATMSRVMVSLYAARFEDASRLIEDDWPKLDRAYFLKLQYFRVACLYLRGLAAIGAAHAAPKKKGPSLALAERCADALEAEKMRWTEPLAQALRAGVADHRGQTDRAVRALRSAVTGFQGVAMSLHEAAARLRLGETLGGEEGRQLIEQALAKMSVEGIRSPIRYSLALVPISSQY